MAARSDELRNRSHSLDSFPSHLATTGTRAWFDFSPAIHKRFQDAVRRPGEWHGHRLGKFDLSSARTVPTTSARSL